MEVTHLCTIKARHSFSFLPPLGERASLFAKMRRNFRKYILISSQHPKAVEFFKSTTGLLRERRRHVNLNLLHIIHPFSKFRVYYELYMVLLYCVIFSFRTVRLHAPIGVIENQKFESCIIILLHVIHIIITFFTGYAEPKVKEVILEPAKIARHYVTSLYFAVDVIFFVPWDIILATLSIVNEVDAWLISVLVRSVIIMRIYTMNVYLIDVAEYFEVRSNTYFKLIQYALTTFLLTEYFAFFLFTVPLFRIIDGYGDYKIRLGSWVYQARLMYQPTYKIFIMSMFRATSLILTTDAGLYDMVVWEDILGAIITMTFGKVYIIALTVLILNLVIQNHSLDTKYEEVISQLKQYIEYRSLPKKLSKRLLLYYEYKYQKKFFKEDLINNTLSDQLKREINLHVCKKLVNSVTLFADMSERNVSDILEYLILEIYLPNDVLINAGDNGDCLYLLANGTVAVYSPSGREICHLQDGAYFGEIALVLKDQNRTATVIAAEICEVYKLQRRYFKQFFTKDPLLYQKIYRTAEDRFELLVNMEEFYKNRSRV